MPRLSAKKKLALPIRKFATPDLITASADRSIEELVRIMVTNDVRHLPIVKDSHVVGVVSDRDCRIASGLSSEEKKLVLASDVMTADPVSFRSDTRLEEVVSEMVRRKIGSVIINDENDKLHGIFTETDALNVLLQILRSTTSRRITEATKSVSAAAPLDTEAN